MFGVLSVGPIPTHVAFIMDGNRRYAKKYKLDKCDGHRAGFMNLIAVVSYCFEMGVKYVTAYAFSIDNFKRRPDEVKCLMDLMLEKIDELLKEGSTVDRYGVRLLFIGNLSLLPDNVQSAAEKAMKITACHNKAFLLICIAYTSTDEIAHAIELSCKDKIQEVINEDSGHVTDEGKKEKETKGMDEGGDRDSGDSGSTITTVGEQEDTSTGETRAVTVADLERNMYMAVAPGLDVMIRSSGETRLSNFLLWQTWGSPLYAPRALWPELGLLDLVWAVVKYQRSYSYLQKQMKMS
ncbi:hypothetical protein MLD38_028700 [Melastoma candidum]|uniref:Uncharacterized protein n=1 Tax=Melastoma candidum TaxID=119954 RepID=A0ACB9N7L7_9MYRT|nr:hypothetical protein MLD38_028700 [Melastoma candidum]